MDWFVLEALRFPSSAHLYLSKGSLISIGRPRLYRKHKYAASIAHQQTEQLVLVRRQAHRRQGEHSNTRTVEHSNTMQFSRNIGKHAPDSIHNAYSVPTNEFLWRRLFSADASSLLLQTVYYLLHVRPFTFSSHRSHIYKLFGIRFRRVLVPDTNTHDPRSAGITYSLFLSPAGRLGVERCSESASLFDTTHISICYVSVHVRSVREFCLWEIARLKNILCTTETGTSFMSSDVRTARFPLSVKFTETVLSQPQCCARFMYRCCWMGWCWYRAKFRNATLTMSFQVR